MNNKETFMEKLMLTWFPLVAVITMMVSYFPQIMLTYTTQNVEGQSLSFWILLSIGLFGMLLQQIGMIKYNGLDKKMGLVFQAINLILALVMLVGVIIFS